jgi:hypothetical protein
MPNWRDEYLSNIEKAQNENNVDRDLIAACQCDLCIIPRHKETLPQN